VAEFSRAYVRHVCAAHQHKSVCCLAHGAVCPLTSASLLQPGAPDRVRLAEQARATLRRSSTVWVQTAYVAGPIAWHATTAEGSVALALSAENHLITDLERQLGDVPAVLAAAELGPAGSPDRVLHRVWLAGWLRKAWVPEVEELIRLITGQGRCPHVARRVLDLRVLVLDVTEILVPEGRGPDAIYSVDLIDYALASPPPG